MNAEVITSAFIFYLVNPGGLVCPPKPGGRLLSPPKPGGRELPNPGGETVGGRGTGLGGGIIGGRCGRGGKGNGLKCTVGYIPIDTRGV